jgi:hypothetical protein
MDGLCIDSIRLHNNLEWTIMDSKQQIMDSIWTLQGCTIILNGLFWIVNNKEWTLYILYKVAQ